MIKFIDFINESSTIKFSFIYKGEIISFEENQKKEIFIEVVDWLSEMKYSFSNVTNQSYYPNLVDEIPIGSRASHYHRINSINKYIDINFIKQFQGLFALLKDFGINEDTIKFDVGLNKNLVETPTEKTKKYFLLGAYSKDNPDWWKQCVEEGKWYNGFALGGDSRLDDKVNEIPVGANVAIKSTYTRQRTQPAMMIKARGVVTKNYEDGTQLDVEWEKDFTPFEMVRNDVGGYRATLHEVSNQEHIDLIWNSDGNDEPEEEKEIMSPYDFFSSSTGGRSTYSIKDEPTIVAAKPDKYDITLTRDPQKTNKIEKPSSFTGHKTNPFRQAICVLGKSGMGKSTTIEKVLISLKDNMEYEYIIPTASTTNLLAQYSPGSNRYIQSRLGKLIMKAQKNPERLFTAVFDECHKANVIEMINDELLQAISTYRNLTKRFISVDDDTAELYDGLTPDNSGNLLIPNNFGFIFLSSKPNIIIDNEDFFNRVDIYVLENQPPKDEVDLCTVIGSSIILNPKYFESIGDRQNGSKTAADVDRIKELHK